MKPMRIATLYLGTGDNGFKTNIGAIGETDKETMGLFESAKKISVSVETAVFLMDLYNNDGFIVDTIGLTGEGYTRITGEKVLSESEYREIDKNYWQQAKDLAAGIRNGSISLDH
jgi:hypothetical protein